MLLRLSVENSRIQRLKEIGIVESELNTEEGKMEGRRDTQEQSTAAAEIPECREQKSTGIVKITE